MRDGSARRLGEVTVWAGGFVPATEVPDDGCEAPQQGLVADSAADASLTGFPAPMAATSGETVFPRYCSRTEAAVCACSASCEVSID
ncbi:MAG: hypothetical protein ACLP6E_10665 [Acidimicrobiales bacterium]